ncbi:hypothetical protein [Micromonospora sp. RP3T]|uniref:hypothetical protein n=1 Tax=Micromonospora sp. RP3T TaxID=2135446 RepID=UPI003D728A90
MPFEVFHPADVRPAPPEVMFNHAHELLFNPAAAELLNKVGEIPAEKPDPRQPMTLLVGHVGAELLFDADTGFMAVRTARGAVGSARAASLLPFIPWSSDWPVRVPAAGFLARYRTGVRPGMRYPARVEPHPDGLLLVIGLGHLGRSA